MPPWDQLRPLLWYVLCIVVILGFAYWAARHVGKHGGFGFGPAPRGQQTGKMVILSQLAVGRDQRLVIVDVGGRYLLLGVSQNGISCLTELTENEIANLRQRGEEIRPEGFSEVLERLKKNRKQG